MFSCTSSAFSRGVVQQWEAKTEPNRPNRCPAWDPDSKIAVIVEEHGLTLLILVSESIALPEESPGVFSDDNVYFEEGTILYCAYNPRNIYIYIYIERIVFRKIIP